MNDTTHDEPYEIKASEFRRWLDRQPDERVWDFCNTADCVVCCFVKETTGAKVVNANPYNFDLGTVDRQAIPPWLKNVLDAAWRNNAPEGQRIAVNLKAAMKGVQ